MVRVKDTRTQPNSYNRKKSFTSTVRRGVPTAYRRWLRTASEKNSTKCFVATQKVTDVPSVEEAEVFVQEMCGQHSTNLARLQEEKDKLERHLGDIERQMRDEHERLRVGNELSDIHVRDRQRREEEISAMKESTMGSKPMRSSGEVPYRTESQLASGTRDY